jgi:hypothetical protein
MPGEAIADDQHVVRHCESKFFFDDDTISPGNFMLRRKEGQVEEYLSVGWLARYGAAPRANQIAAYRKVIHPNIRKFKTSDKLAVLNVGHSKETVRAGTPDNRIIEFRHWPMPAPREDAGHSGIHNTAENEARVAELLGASVIEEYPAR